MLVTAAITQANFHILATQIAHLFKLFEIINTTFRLFLFEIYKLVKN